MRRHPASSEPPQSGLSKQHLSGGAEVCVLSTRTQCVQVAGVRCTHLEVTKGVPHGSAAAF